MKFNKAQLHVLYTALHDAIEWEKSLADAHQVFGADAGIRAMKRKADTRALQFSNLREQIGRELRGEDK